MLRYIEGRHENVRTMMRLPTSIYNRFRDLTLEYLENRIALTGDTSCHFELAELPQSEATRAVRSVNCFGLDLYEHFQREEGNVVISPFSISTALAMAYAGADGNTATEMEEVLHLGSESGIHDSYSALLTSLIRDEAYYDLFVACLLYTSPSPRDQRGSRMPSSA